jgi:hypothetical protein
VKNKFITGSKKRVDIIANDEFYDLFSSPHIVSVIKSKMDGMSGVKASIKMHVLFWSEEAYIIKFH